jgi:hypothetical protein
MTTEYDPTLDVPEEHLDGDATLERIADALDTLNRGLGAVVIRLERIALAAEKAADRAAMGTPVPMPDQRPVTPVAVNSWDLPAQRATIGNGQVCPTHNVPWKLVPAGVSKTSGKAYNAFWSCQVRDCKLRPPADYQG